MIGQTISHYKITAKLGGGGMGVVYKAEDTRLGRNVALKFLPEEFQQDSTAKKRFLREARSAAALDHPYICHIHEVGEVEGKSFISMEYVQGKTLQEQLAEGPLPLDDTLEKATEVAEALEEAHRQGIVHRDLKPSNIMLTPQGHVKVMDFGLAKRVTPIEGQEEEITTALTREGSTLGTVPYMSPEQIRGQTVDTQSDIFSFGVVLFEMLTGFHPFKKASPLDTASSILRDEPSPLSDYVPELPEVLQHTVQKMLAKRVEDRCQSAAEVRIDLEQLTGGVPFMPRRLRPTRRQILSITGLAVMVTLTTLLGLDVGGWRGWLSQLLGVGGAPRIQSLAVLPLENLSGDPDQEYLAAGMHEALITDLAKIGALKVISRTSAMRYKGTDKPLRQIAEELNVDTIIEGSAQRVGDSVRITAQLIDAETDQHLWAESYDRNVADVLVLQSELARAIAQQIRVTLSPEEDELLAKARTVNPEVYEAYLRGTFYLNQETPEGIERGLAYLHEAVEKDPADPLAYAGLALGYVNVGHGSAAGKKDVFPRARAAALQALKLDDMLGEAHAALAEVQVYYEWDWVGAEESFRRALELNPSLANAHYHYGWHLAVLGRDEEATVEMKRAQELDPLVPLYTAWLGGWYWYKGRYDEAIDEAQKSLELSPDYPIAYHVLGLAYASKGMYEEAIAAHQRSTESIPPWRSTLGVTYALAGRMEEAREILAEIKQGGEPASPLFLAELYAVLGEKDEAFRSLNESCDVPEAFAPSARIDPIFEPIRDDPRFHDLLRRMNLEL